LEIVTGVSRGLSPVDTSKRVIIRAQPGREVSLGDAVTARDVGVVVVPVGVSRPVGEGVAGWRGIEAAAREGVRQRVHRLDEHVVVTWRRGRDLLAPGGRGTDSDFVAGLGGAVRVDIKVL